MIAPDIICVEVHDVKPDYTGGMEEIAPASDAWGFVTTQKPCAARGGTLTDCWIGGPNKTWARFWGDPITDVLDRAAARVAGDYTITGGTNPTVDAVGYWNNSIYTWMHIA